MNWSIKRRYDTTILAGARDSENCYSRVLIAPGLPPLAPNPLFPDCAGTRLRVGAVSDRSAIDRVNTAAENSRGSDLARSRLAPDALAGSTDRDHRRDRLRMWQAFRVGNPCSKALILETGMAGVETAQATQHQTNSIAPR
jgi:hypothetical protein